MATLTTGHPIPAIRGSPSHRAAIVGRRRPLHRDGTGGRRLASLRTCPGLPGATRGYPGLPGEVDGADAVGWNGMQPLKSVKSYIYHDLLAKSL